MSGDCDVKRVLDGERIDRIPVAPFIHVNYVDEFFAGRGTDALRTIEIYDHFGFDIIFRNCTVDSFDERLIDSPSWRVATTEAELAADQSWRIETIIRTPDRELRQVKDRRRVSEYEVVEAITEHFIKEEADFEQFVRYQPPVPPYNMTLLKQAAEALGGRGLTAPWAQGAFNMASMYRKLDDLLIDPYINPSFYDTLMNYFLERTLAVMRQYIENGADLISCAGNVANGGVVGPDYFAAYILPYEAQLARMVKSLGAYHLYHNCGDAKVLLPVLPRIGMSLYESLTPPPYGNTDLETALAAFDRSITLSGNIDQIDLLRQGPAEAIDEAVRLTLGLAAKRGNFILATTDYFNENTPEAHIIAFAEAARRYGRI